MSATTRECPFPDSINWDSSIPICKWNDGMGRKTAEKLFQKSWFSASSIPGEYLAWVLGSPVSVWA
ncbi:hypothetical protein GBAR_LOCUS1808 [Geodia barretti]|uniref:Uncharacterized protein n=1 Tax=Geodia barretti TaxID=519541 RepID=A0AA35QYA3_GEOBA|nr:hypothetical protein GBAR_LOCUS1808 [Geodia barretti]